MLHTHAATTFLISSLLIDIKGIDSPPGLYACMQAQHTDMRMLSILDTLSHALTQVGTGDEDWSWQYKCGNGTFLNDSKL